MANVRRVYPQSKAFMDPGKMVGRHNKRSGTFDTAPVADVPSERLITVKKFGETTLDVAVRFNGKPLTDTRADDIWEGDLRKIYVEDGQGMLDNSDTHASIEPVPDEIEHLDFDLFDLEDVSQHSDDVHSKHLPGYGDRSQWPSINNKTRTRK